MEWWGWGHSDVSFTHEDRPELAPFIRQELSPRRTRDGHAPPIAFDELTLPEPVPPGALRDALERAVGAEHVSTHDGSVSPLRSGAAVLAAEHGTPPVAETFERTIDWAIAEGLVERD